MSPLPSNAWWPNTELSVAVAALARHTGMPINPSAHASINARDDSGERVETACENLGLESEEVLLHGHQLVASLRAGAPALVPVEDRGWLVLVEARGKQAELLTPELSVLTLPLDEMRQVICERSVQPHRAEAERILNHGGIDSRRMARARDALIESRLRHQQVGTLHAVRVPPGTSFSRQLREAGVLRWLVLLIGAHAAEYVFLIAAWAVIGRTALEGRFDSGMLIAWLLLLATMVPCRWITTWAQGVIAVRAGGLLRQRLLAGILRLEPEEVRHEGAGAFLARAIEAEMVESLALSGGLAALLSLVELFAAACVLAAGSALLELPLLGLWCVVTAILAWRYWRAQRTWTDARLTMTHEVVENMVGHRTRLAQQPPAEWHLEEDRRLDAYLAASQTMDAQGARLEGLIPRAWFLMGIVGLAPAFLSAQDDPGALAISLGGVILAWRALRRLTTGLANLSGAAISWNRVASLFHAATRVETLPRSASVSRSEAVIEARDLAYRYSRDSRAVIDGLDLEIHRGEKILIEGASGGGKSTLVAMLAGLRQPTRGLLTSGGLDRATLGAGRWRQRISLAPQYHDNHVLGGTFAYNLLLGRRWPATEDDLREAEEIAREAGLGPLLDRMPAGLMQIVGETGWQLSSGERSRLYLCRALLSGADLMIVDESFAALDPHTLRQALECSLRRAKSLMVVAHP